MTKFFKGKNVLVAGGTGVIGIPLVYQLSLLNCKKITVVSTHSKSYAKKILPKKVKFFKSDLRSFKNCLYYTKNMDVVFNLIGIKGSVTQKESNVSNFFYSMTMFQTNLMHASKINKVLRFLFVSSICGYPRSANLKKEENFWQGLPKQNDMIPGLVKRIGEIQGLGYLKQDKWKAVRIVRPSNVFGPHDDFDPKTGQVIPSLISKIVNAKPGKTIDIYGSDTVRDFVFSKDVANIIIKVASSNTLVCEPLNVGSGKGISIKQLALNLKNIIKDKNIKFRYKPSDKYVDKKRVLSISKLKKNIKDINFTPFSNALKDTVSWYIKNVR